jgi:hypothetical protein
MTVETFRLQLIKIGVLVKEKGTKVFLHLPSHFVWKELFSTVWQYG